MSTGTLHIVQFFALHKNLFYVSSLKPAEIRWPQRNVLESQLDDHFMGVGTPLSSSAINHAHVVAVRYRGRVSQHEFGPNVLTYRRVRITH